MPDERVRSPSRNVRPFGPSRLFVERLVMDDSIEAGLMFGLSLAGAESGAVLVSAGEELTVRAQRMWAPPLLETARELWVRLCAGDDGPLLDTPVLAFPGRVSGHLAGLFCVALPSGPGCRVSFSAVSAFAHILVAQAVQPTMRGRAAGLKLIRDAADPAAVLVRLLERHRWNVSSLADELGCTRKAIYAACRRYRVTIVRPR